VHADKAGSAKGRYNRASLATRALSEIWAESAGHVSTLAEALRSAPDAERRLRQHIPAEGRGEFSADDLSRRLQHFIDEDARVPLALDAFRRADAMLLGSLSDDSQYDADVLLGNQVEETIRLARAAREHGAFAASSFGAGFGGSVWALVDADDAEDFVRRWHRAYTASATPGPVESFVTRPAPRVTGIDVSES
jgi:galactokinase